MNKIANINKITTNPDVKNAKGKISIFQSEKMKLQALYRPETLDENNSAIEIIDKTLREELDNFYSNEFEIDKDIDFYIFRKALKTNFRKLI